MLEVEEINKKKAWVNMEKNSCWINLNGRLMMMNSMEWFIISFFI